jgi:DNA-binding MarR family transcriptional regulator
MLVNRLVAQGLVQTLPNPDHKRSYLVCLSPGGTALFEEMERRERDVLAQMELDLSPGEVQMASRILERLQERLLRWHHDQ